MNPDMKIIIKAVWLYVEAEYTYRMVADELNLDYFTVTGILIHVNKYEWSNSIKESCDESKG